MRVLVTGANGFLGRHVVAELLQRGHTVRALVRPATKVDALGWPDSVEIVRGDLRVPAGLGSIFDGVDVLLHLAAAVTGGDDAQFASGVVGTERLLGLMATSSTKRLVLASSFSVYDWDRIHGTLDEDSPTEVAPRLYERDGYAVAKVWQERVARAEANAHGWSLTVLRPGFIWGKGNVDLACLGQRVGPFYLAFGPRSRIPLTHVENCADCFADSVEAPSSGGTFNVVDGDEVRVWDYLGEYLRRSRTRAWRLPLPYVLVNMFVHLAHATSKAIFRGKGKLPSLLVPRRFHARFKPLRFDNRKAREGLNWRPKLSYRDGLDRTYGPEAETPARVVPEPDPAPERTPVAAHD